MKSKSSIKLAAGILAAFCAAPLWAASFYTLRPEDPKAIYLSKSDSALHGDGVGDDTDAIKNAINIRLLLRRVIATSSTPSLLKSLTFTTSG